MEITYNQMVMELLNQAVCSGSRKATIEERNIWCLELRELNKRDRIIKEVEIDAYLKNVTEDHLVYIDLDNFDSPFRVDDNLVVPLTRESIYKILATWRHKSIEEARGYFWSLKQWSYEKISSEDYEKYAKKMIVHLFHNGENFLNQKDDSKSSGLIALYRSEIESLITRDSVLTQVETSNLLQRAKLVHSVPTFYAVGEDMKDFDIQLIWSTLLQWRIKGFSVAFDYFYNRIVGEFGLNLVIQKD